MPTTEYKHVRFEPRSGFTRCHLRRDDAATLTMPEISSPQRLFNGSIKHYSFEELSDIHHFMSQLRKDGDT